MKIKILIDGKRWRVRTYKGRLFYNGEEYGSLIVEDDREIRMASSCTLEERADLIGRAIISIAQKNLQPKTGREM